MKLNNIEKLNIQGYQYLLEGKSEDALHCFKEGLDIEPNNPVLLNNLGNALFNLEEYNRAEETYLQAISVDSTYSKSYKNLALLYQKQGSPDKAIAMYQNYLMLVPEDGESHYNLGLLYIAQRKNEKIFSTFEKAIKYLLPDNTEKATNIGFCYLHQGNYKKANALFEKALEFNSSYIPALYHRATILLYENKFQEAIQILKHILEIDPHYKHAKVNLAIAYNSIDDTKKAIDLLYSLLGEDPNDSSVMINLGYAYQNDKQYEKAKECFQRVISNNLKHNQYYIKAERAIQKLIGH